MAFKHFFFHISIFFLSPSRPVHFVYYVIFVHIAGISVYSGIEQTIGDFL